MVTLVTLYAYDIALPHFCEFRLSLRRLQAHAGTKCVAWSKLWTISPAKVAHSAPSSHIQRVITQANLLLAASLFACMSAALWAAVAPEPEGRAMQVINARRRELIINKPTSRPFAVRGSSGCLLPSVVEVTLLLHVCWHQRDRRIYEEESWFMF